MQVFNQIIIGSGLYNVSEQEGQYAVYLNTKLIFDNCLLAVEAYSQYSGEATIWDLGNQNVRVRLLQAKLFKDCANDETVHVGN